MRQDVVLFRNRSSRMVKMVGCTRAPWFACVLLGFAGCANFPLLRQAAANRSDLPSASVSEEAPRPSDESQAGGASPAAFVTAESVIPDPSDRAGEDLTVQSEAAESGLAPADDSDRLGPPPAYTLSLDGVLELAETQNPHVALARSASTKPTRGSGGRERSGCRRSARA